MSRVTPACHNMVVAAATVAGIFIASEEAAPVVAVDHVRAVPGRGLAGDRYYKIAASRERAAPEKEVTLIASEGLEAARAEHGLALAAGEHRRNIVTSGVDLETLLGRSFRIGGAVLEGLERNPPCRYLARLTGKDVVKPLIAHGGIRARILQEGTIRVGDSVEVVAR